LKTLVVDSDDLGLEVGANERVVKLPTLVQFSPA
jgi:hypothetical protein